MRLIVFLTGGSRGFGRSFAQELAGSFFEVVLGGSKDLPSPAPSPSASSASIVTSAKDGKPEVQPSDHLTIVLLSRDEEGMAATAADVSSACPGCEVVMQKMDLADLDNVESSWNTVLSKLAFGPMGAAGHDVAWLVNNSGSLGPLGNLRELGTEGSGGIRALKQAVDLNVTATMWLSSLFLRDLHAGKITQPRAAASSKDKGKEGGGAASEEEGDLAASLPHLVLNVSSLCAIKAFPSQASYCVGKAARDMLTMVLATEEEEGTKEAVAFPVKTLNYAPGPLDTDMQRELRESDVLEPRTRDMFKGMKAEGTLIHPNRSAKKCIRQLLFPDKFASGSHVDYYDLH